MPYATLMTGFPPAPDNQVTLANWRTAPFNFWAFRHVRELIATAPIKAADGTAVPARPANDLTGLTIEGHGTLGDVLPATHTDALHVLKAGKAHFEWFAPGVSPRDRHIVFSVSKSFTAAIAGSMQADGLVDFEAPVVRYVPEAAASAYADCTVQHLLDMTVCIDFDETYLASDGPFIRYRQSMGWNPLDDPANPPDLRAVLLEFPRLPGTHGDRFHYVSPNSDMLGWVLERAAGKRFSHLMQERLWQPMQALSDAEITIDRLGAPRSAGGLCMTVQDMARFGELMRLGGVWNGRQVLPQDWVEDTVSGGSREAWQRGDLADYLPNGRYRNKWYQTGNDASAFCAIGIHGQWIYIDPKHETVIARQSSQPLPIDDAADQIWFKAFDAIARSG